MKYLGLTNGHNHFHKELHDGSIAVVENASIQYAYMEERVARKLRAGGYCTAIEVDSSCKEADVISISTCTESVEYPSVVKGIDDSNKVIHVDHHLSHALCAFELSGFEKSLVVVIDGGGNTLDGSDKCWWSNKRQQHSYYYISNNSVQLLERDFSEPDELGFGELFRSMTYLLGYNSSKKAAHVTALASYGNYKQISEIPFITLKNGKLISPCKYSSESPELSLAPVWDIIGKKFHKLEQNTVVPKEYCDLCAYFQWNIERAMLEKLSYLKKTYHIENLCLSGGVALNCVLNAKIVEAHYFERVFIPFCPGDHGQSLGNVFYSMRENNEVLKPDNISPYLGTDVDTTTFSDIVALQKKYNYHEPLYVFENNCNSIIDSVSKLLIQDIPFFICHGRSEFGLRALGNRSIICRSDLSESKNIVEKIKQRERFRPFAPIVHEDYVSELLGDDVISPFMTTAFLVENPTPIRNCCSIDNRSRIQTVNGNSFWGKILQNLANTGIFPSCLNTSLNLKGEPIAENGEDAFDMFIRTEIQSMVLGNYCIHKEIFPEIFPRLNFNIEIRDKNNTISVNKNQITSKELIEYIQSFTGIRNIYFRRYFGLNHEYLSWLKNGRKNTTIRFKKGYLELPVDCNLNMWPTTNFEKLSSNLANEDSECVNVHINTLVFTRFGDLTEEDAYNDGFKSYSEMRQAFEELMYPNISDSDWVMIYRINIFD